MDWHHGDLTPQVHWISGIPAERKALNVIASFSSSGPTPISLQMKPDVSAPGVEIVSSVPSHEGNWATFSGTSMAAPHVAGAAALLAQRHPAWTVEQIKSALVQTGGPVYTGNLADETESTREAAVKEVARRYQEWVDIFEKARAS